MTLPFPRRVLIVASLGWVLAANTAAIADEAVDGANRIDGLLKKSEHLYRTRDRAGRAERALTLYHQILQIDPRHEEALWKLSRSFHWQGENAPQTQDKKAAFRSAVQYAKQAISIQPASIGGHLMLAMAYGRIAEMEGIMKALLLIAPIKSEIRTVLQLDPKNDVAHHLLGVFYRKIPRLLGGSIEKSLRYLHQATRENPSRTRHYLELAHTYLKQNKRDEAIAQLEFLMSIREPEHPVQTKLDRQNALGLLAALRAK